MKRFFCLLALAIPFQVYAEESLIESRVDFPQPLSVELAGKTQSYLIESPASDPFVREDVVKAGLTTMINGGKFNVFSVTTWFTREGYLHSALVIVLGVGQGMGTHVRLLIAYQDLGEKSIRIPSYLHDTAEALKETPRELRIGTTSVIREHTSEMFITETYFCSAVPCPGKDNTYGIDATTASTR